MADLPNYFDPQVPPVIPATAPLPLPPEALPVPQVAQPPSEFEQFMNDPRGRGMLLQLGLAMMQPRDQGQSGFGQLAQGIGAAGEYADRVSKPAASESPRQQIRQQNAETSRQALDLRRRAMSLREMIAARKQVEAASVPTQAEEDVGDETSSTPRTVADNSGTLAKAKAALAAGAPREAVIARLRANGIDPSGL